MREGGELAARRGVAEDPGHITLLPSKLAPMLGFQL